MTDLTDKWKKGGLLDEEDYYIKWKDSEVFTATFVDFMNRKMFQRMTLEFEELPTEHYLSVLAPVPSYEEWQALNGNMDSVMQTNQALCKKLKQLKEELKDYEYQHKQDGICYDDIFCKLELARKENRTLKELLKECKDEIDYLRKHYKGNIDHLKNNTRLDKEINQALGEDK